MARIWSFLGRSAHSALRPILKLSFLRKVALLAKQSESASPAMFAKSALNTRSLTMSDLVSGAAFQSVNAVASSVALKELLLDCDY
jgi:hypothetical protein